MSTKFHFSEVQRQTLRVYYHGRGITSVSAKNAATIDQITAEIGATSTQVKVTSVMLAYKCNV